MIVLVLIIILGCFVTQYMLVIQTTATRADLAWAAPNNVFLKLKDTAKFKHALLFYIVVFVLKYNLDDQSNQSNQSDQIP